MSNKKGERNHWIRKSGGFERVKTSEGVKGHKPPRPASIYLQRLEPRKAAHSHRTDALIPLKNWTNSTNVKWGWRCDGACTAYLVEMHVDKSSLKQFYTRRIMFINELQHPVTNCTFSLHHLENRISSTHLSKYYVLSPVFQKKICCMFYSATDSFLIKGDIFLLDSL